MANNKSKQSMARAKQTMEFRTVRSHQSNLLQQQKVQKKNSMNMTGDRDSKSLEKKRHHVRSHTGGAITTLVKKKSANNTKNKLFTSISSDERQRSHDRAKMTSVNISNHSGKENAVAKHLSKMYFLNSKQLLKLLSPPREPGLSGASTSMLNQTQQAGMQQGESELNDELRTWFQSGRGTTTGQTMRSGTVQAHTGRSTGNQQRQRNRSSIGVNLSIEINEQVAACAQKRQRNHSHSQTRQKKPLAHNTAQSFNLGQPQPKEATVVGPRKSVDIPNPKSKMDRLIKSNLKKQKTKFENQEKMRELLELQQTQRKTQLTLLNKKVRDANKSKLQSQQQNVMTHVPASTSHKRSVSCQRKRPSLSDERAAADNTHQLDKAAVGPQIDARRRKEGSKIIPFSATHGRTKGFKFNQLPGQQRNQKCSNSPQSNRPKIFDELNLLTRQIEQEIDQEGGVTANTTKVLDQGRDSSARNSDLNFYSLKARRSKELGKSIDQPLQSSTACHKVVAGVGFGKKKRASVDIQKYIERCKRRQTIKRERELHNEFDKKLQIQRNLSKLNAFTKRNSKSTSGGFSSAAATHGQPHQRQRSVPASVNRHHLDKSSAPKTLKHKKPKAANKTMSGLRDIFNGAATSVSLNQTNINLASSTDAAQQHDYNQYLTAFENSAQLNRSQQRQQKYNKAKQKYPAGSGVGGASKTSHDGPSGPTYLPLKHPVQRAINSESFPYHERQRSDFNKSQTIQQRQKTLMSATGKSPDVLGQSHLTSEEALHNSRNRPISGVSSGHRKEVEVTSSVNKVQAQPIAFEKSISSRSEIEASSSHLASMRPSRIRNKKQNSNSKNTKAEKVEQIRRVHEIVAMYRKRFKKGASDASIMGTLHLAASIIQIHFRYQKQLKEANRLQEQYLKKKQESRDRKSRTDVAPSSSRYINTEKSATSMSLPQQSPAPANINEQESPAQPVAVEQPRLDEVNAQHYKQRRPQSVSIAPSQVPSQATHQRQRGGSGIQFPLQLNNFMDQTQQFNRETPVDKSSANLRTPVIPELDFNKLKPEEESRSKQKPGADQIEIIEASNSEPDDGAHGEERTDQQSHYIESAAKESDAKTVSSYSAIFQKIGMPLPRSARVRVEYGLVSRDPGLIEQIRNLVSVKQEKGNLALKESRQLELISERTYHLKSKKLEKWVAVKHERLDEMRQQSRSRQKVKPRTSEELLAEAEEERERMSKILEAQDLQRASFSSQGRAGITSLKSGRSLGRLSYRSQSWRGGKQFSLESNTNDHCFNLEPTNNGMPFAYNPPTQLVSKNQSSRRGSGEVSQREDLTSRDQNVNFLVAPTSQQQQQIVMGSGRDQKSKIVELINSQSSRTHSGMPEAQISSESADKAENEAAEAARAQAAAVRVSDNEVQQLMRIRETQDPYQVLHGAGTSFKSSSQGGHELEERRSLTKSLLSQLDQADDFLPAEKSDSPSPVEKSSALIETQLEQALHVEQQREETGIVQPTPSPADFDSDPKSQQHSPAQESANGDKVEEPIHFHNKQFLDQLRQDDLRELSGDAPTFQPVSPTSTSANQNAILVMNQSQERPDAEERSGRKLEIETGANTSLHGAAQPHEGQLSAPNTQQQNNVGFSSSSIPMHPQTTTSPLSDSQAHEVRILTGAQSLSSTDSDITKVIRAQQEAFDSPPNVLSPQNAGLHPLLRVVDQASNDVPQTSPEASSPAQQMSAQQQEADDLATAILQQLVAELRQDIEIIIPRQQIQPRQNYIRYFEKKGIKTDLCAIEKYVDEMMLQVRGDEAEFNREIRSCKARDELQTLYEMQNSPIGTFEHFQTNQPNVLALELYLNLERRRRESPESRFDFENVTDADLMEDRVDRNFLAECQYIHNKVLFDCINDSLQQFRPYGKDGMPPTWSRQQRKLRPTDDFSLVEMFEVAKHDLFRMAIMQAGTLPRREFVFGGQFDEELFTELREKKLAALLCREIVDSEPQWLKWDFEEAQTKVDLSDMVLEHLVSETIDVLTKNEAKRRAMQ